MSTDLLNYGMYEEVYYVFYVLHVSGRLLHLRFFGNDDNRQILPSWQYNGPSFLPSCAFRPFVVTLLVVIHSVYTSDDVVKAFLSQLEYCYSLKALCISLCYIL